MTIYSGLDEAGQLTYTVVFNAADRESPYVLDVILHNKVISTDAHATDMHGFSEVNYAVTGLIEVELRPRFVTIHRQRLYSIDAVSTYKEQAYKLVPDARIDYEHLVEQWDNLLRFVASIKLGYTQASTLLKRLNRTGGPVLRPAASALQSPERFGPTLQNGVHSALCG